MGAATVTPDAVRDGDPDALAGLTERRGPSVLAYCRLVAAEGTATAAAADAFARFRSAVADADDPYAVNPEALLLSATRHAAAQRSGASGTASVARLIVRRPAQATCAVVPHLLVARAEGVIYDDDAARLDRHLETCAACRRRREHFEAAERAYRDPPSQPLSPEVAATIVAAMIAAAPINGVEGGAAGARAAAEQRLRPTVELNSEATTPSDEARAAEETARLIAAVPDPAEPAAPVEAAAPAAPAAPVEAAAPAAPAAPVEAAAFAAPAAPVEAAALAAPAAPFGAAAPVEADPPEAVEDVAGEVADVPVPAVDEMPLPVPEPPAPVVDEPLDEPRILRPAPRHLLRLPLPKPVPAVQPRLRGVKRPSPPPPPDEVASDMPAEAAPDMPAEIAADVAAEVVPEVAAPVVPAVVAAEAAPQVSAEVAFQAVVDSPPTLRIVPRRLDLEARATKRSDPAVPVVDAPPPDRAPLREVSAAEPAAESSAAASEPAVPFEITPFAAPPPVPESPPERGSGRAAGGLRALRGRAPRLIAGSPLPRPERGAPPAPARAAPTSANGSGSNLRRPAVLLPAGLTVVAVGAALAVSGLFGGGNAAPDKDTSADRVQSPQDSLPETISAPPAIGTARAVEKAKARERARRAGSGAATEPAESKPDPPSAPEATTDAPAVTPTPAPATVAPRRIAPATQVAQPVEPRSHPAEPARRGSGQRRSRCEWLREPAHARRRVLDPGPRAASPAGQPEVGARAGRRATASRTSAKNRSCRRVSVPSSGWKATAVTAPWRAATGCPSTSARISTLSP